MGVIPVRDGRRDRKPQGPKVQTDDELAAKNEHLIRATAFLLVSPFTVSMGYEERRGDHTAVRFSARGSTVTVMLLSTNGTKVNWSGRHLAAFDGTARLGVAPVVVGEKGASVTFTSNGDSIRLTFSDRT